MRLNMKKRVAIMILSLVFVSIFLLMFENSSRFRGKTDNINDAIARNDQNNLYVIDAELNAAEKTLTAVQKVRYVNNEKVALGEIYFHLYPNAFMKRETAPFLFDEFNRAYRSGFAPGAIEIKSMALAESAEPKTLKYGIEGVDSTVMKVELPGLVMPGQAISLEMEYKITIPPASERFGYGENHFNMGNWYPVVAVYDEQGWNVDKYYPIGDPFYSDAADYEVTITMPEEYTIAASGALVEEKKQGGSKVSTYTANSMRDFAFVANTEFQVSEKLVEGVMVRSYYYSGDEFRGQEALGLAEKSIKNFNEAFGKYPYATFSVVETHFPSGMEYPGLVYINDDYYNVDSKYEYLAFTVVHETAHQWWYGIVGNDQVDEAWLDEGLTTYSEVVFTEKEFGKKASVEYAGYFEKAAQDALSTTAFDGTVLKSLKDFKNWEDYGPAVYDMGAVTVNQLRQMVGDDLFFKIMKTYYEEYKFKIATTEDFIEVCERVSKKDLDSYFKKMLQGQ